MKTKINLDCDQIAKAIQKVLDESGIEIIEKFVREMQAAEQAQGRAEPHLRPCPFCGSSKLTIRRMETTKYTECRGCCLDCRALGPWSATERNARWYWNGMLKND